MEENYLHILSLREGASKDEIKKAFRKKAKLLHPDKNNDPSATENFLLVTEAYHYLINKDKLNITELESYSNMSFDDFKGTVFYKRSYTDFEIVFDYFVLFICLSIIFYTPYIGYTQSGQLGLIVASFILLLVSGLLLQGILSLKIVPIKSFLSASFRIIQTKFFWTLFLFLLSNFLFFKIGINTIMSTWVVIVLYLTLGLLGFLSSYLKINYFKKNILFNSLGVFPSILSLFLFLNFNFTKNPKTETYPISHITDWSYSSRGSNSKLIKTSMFTLPDNRFDKNPGLRFFFNQNDISNSTKITYTIENGLFGIQVVKDINLN
ncbi:J domain-containing protein [Flexithrix dorotheae]|uniref:J domain-containing protein n=1 Tax=Flexithrix dorotheae TaxID=70993 RepID=UPI00036A3035|nr:J domain-containing protein [Flexithrix dorotheae]